jgi:DNA-directed RNA polymerase subunit M/transcription elongation factor TFIIS
MQNIDPATEWRNLQDVYSQMTEDELQAVADEAYDLTDVARQVLRSEIKTRQLEIQLREEPPEPSEAAESVEEDDEAFGEEQKEQFDPEDLELVEFCRIWDPNEARRVKKIMDLAGVPSYLGPDNLEDVNLYVGSYEKGAALKVPYRFNQLALRALSNASTDETRTEPDDGSAEVRSFIRCPNCNSPEVVFHNLEKKSAQDDDLEARFNWSCDACGHQWQDDGVEK